MNPADLVGPTLQQTLTHAARILTRSGSATPRLDADLLLAEVLGVERHVLYMETDRRLTPGEQQRFSEFLDRRQAGENMAYILGRKEFYSLTFAVSRAVLIPRPETEVLVDLARERLRDSAAPRVLEVGTGSGCLPITLAVHATDARFTASDLSPEALEVARRNAETHGVSNRIRFVQADGFGGLCGEEPFDLILSNPPYIRTAEISTLDAGIRRYEPRLALDGGEDGLAFYRREIPNLPPHLKPAATVLFEIGRDQADAVSGLFRAAFPDRQVRIHSDLAGRPRVVELTPPR